MAPAAIAEARRADQPTGPSRGLRMAYSGTTRIVALARRRDTMTGDEP